MCLLSCRGWGLVAQAGGRVLVRSLWRNASPFDGKNKDDGSCSFLWSVPAWGFQSTLACSVDALHPHDARHVPGRRFSEKPSLNHVFALPCRTLLLKCCLAADVLTSLTFFSAPFRAWTAGPGALIPQVMVPTPGAERADPLIRACSLKQVSCV